MSRQPAIWPDPVTFLRTEAPDAPMLFFAPAVLVAEYRRFTKGFPGRVTYAVKANASLGVLENLSAAGMTAFDVASPHEMRLVRRINPRAVLHYNNPVRSRAEIVEAASLGVASYSVDSVCELNKLASVVPRGTEVSARLKLDVEGAAYHFGTKFGANVDECAGLLTRIKSLGYRPSLTFHPGTQCSDPAAWSAYINAAAACSRQAGVRLWRVNVGGGFAAHRGDFTPDLEAIFEAIRRETGLAFGETQPELVCEPGRALVAESFVLAARIKSVRQSDGSIFLNDGIYGALAESAVLGHIDRLEVFSPEGEKRKGGLQDRVVFGPTCDSLDRLPGTVGLPGDAREDDYVLFHGMGAYSTATVTQFNGYGHIGLTTVNALVC